MNATANTLEHYLYAKDGNRPDLLRQCFTADATLEMRVHTDTISFPSQVSGRPGIAATLVRDFGQRYENVYTFYVGAPPQPGVARFDCKWLVGMSVKETGELRLGFGEYQWRFSLESGLAEHLKITIDDMQVFAPDTLEPVMDWLQSLTYPWCLPEHVLTGIPPISYANSIADYFAQ
ncbi:nuclear transport factor 2 family protein [Pseudomonas sp. CDFA 602]|uniref:nuclear transport factor 2 family protein n=1 Tax=Pseudomonas californiensis TaxID=2829823 RepID=UPI001E3A76A5|nr:nuclear transport factor 2 family protein [Pseudomonas californiensis]MCD5994248.1 nuclear transport factor 2 family protein [Pseudomonas californiensis]MCD5999653.1 nuclear transport factor 2 family protein [Pseudomonas californiensis]